MRNDMVKYIRNSWLAGNIVADVAAEIFRNTHLYGGILEEKAVYNLINLEYFNLNRAFYCRLERDEMYQNTRKHL